jgi:hypothetical protein
MAQLIVCNKAYNVSNSVDARAGLRGCTQVAVYLYSWVRIPLDVTSFVIGLES